MPSYPIFPLGVVLFPGAMMPLHIFEPRYRRMLADCAEGNHRFVIVPPGTGGSAPDPGAIGTVARIRAIQPLPDGRSNIVVSGEDRITLTRASLGDHPYFTGEVEPLPDIADVQIASGADIATLRSLADRYAVALGALSDVERDADLSQDPGVVTFQVAALLEWDFGAKYLFLAVRSIRERVGRLLHAMPALLADLERRAQVHKGASSNGRGHH